MMSETNTTKGGTEQKSVVLGSVVVDTTKKTEGKVGGSDESGDERREDEEEKQGDYGTSNVFGEGKKSDGKKKKVTQEKFGLTGNFPILGSGSNGSQGGGTGVPIQQPTTMWGVRTYYTPNYTPMLQQQQHQQQPSFHSSFGTTTNIPIDQNLYYSYQQQQQLLQQQQQQLMYYQMNQTGYISPQQLSPRDEFFQSGSGYHGYGNSNWNQKRKFYTGNSNTKKKFGNHPNLFVFHLPQDVNDENLNDLFKQFGKIKSVKVIRNENNSSRGYGFVMFFDVNDAQAAIDKMNGAKVGKKFLKVSFHDKSSKKWKKRKQHKFYSNSHQNNDGDSSGNKSFKPN